MPPPLERCARGDESVRGRCVEAQAPTRNPAARSYDSPSLVLAYWLSRNDPGPTAVPVSAFVLLLPRIVAFAVLCAASSVSPFPQPLILASASSTTFHDHLFTFVCSPFAIGLSRCSAVPPPPHRPPSEHVLDWPTGLPVGRGRAIQREAVDGPSSKVQAWSEVGGLWRGGGLLRSKRATVREKHLERNTTRAGKACRWGMP